MFNRTGYFDVKWFGAKGDDSADDTAAIQAAFGAIGTFGSWGGEVFFPPGTYRIYSRLVTAWMAPKTFNGNVRIRGSEAGSGNTFGGSILKWYGSPTEGVDDSTLLQIGVPNCIVEHLYFTVAPTKSCGPLLNIGYSHNDTTSTAVSNVTIKHCNFSANDSATGSAQAGIAIDYNGIATGNGENCLIYRSTFHGFLKACIYIRGGQPFNTVVDNCYLSNSGLNTLGDYPYGLGIRVDTASCSLHVNATSFDRLGAAVCLVNYPSSTVLVNCEGEFNKKLVYHAGYGQGDLATVSILGGRFAVQAAGYVSQGSFAAFPAADTDCVTMTGDAALVIQGVSFSSGPEILPFRVYSRGNINSASNVYPNSNPFKCDTYWEDDNPPKVFSSGDYYPTASGNNAALPTLRGFRQPGGTVTFGPTDTAKAVSFTVNAEGTLSPAGAPLNPNYRVILTIQSAAGGATITTPYVSALSNTGFTISLPSPPGASVVVGYDLVR